MRCSLDFKLILFALSCERAETITEWAFRPLSGRSIEEGINRHSRSEKRCLWGGGVDGSGGRSLGAPAISAGEHGGRTGHNEDT